MTRSNESLELQSSFATRYPTDFESEVLAEHIRDGLRRDEQLIALCDASVAADEATETRTETETDAVREAWGTLRHQTRQRALELVAEACALVLEKGDAWVESGDRDGGAVEEAQTEAAEWLSYHSNEAARAGVLGVQIDHPVEASG